MGGQAKRLMPLTAEVAKPVVRLLNRPIIETVLTSLAKQGVRHFIFGVKGYVNYRSLHDYFKDGVEVSARYDINPRVHIKYQPRIEDVGSADSLRIVMDYYGIDAPVIVAQGDNLFDVDLADLAKFHEEHQAFMTVALTRVEDVTGYGIAELDADFRIKRFVEKPRKSQAPSNLANAGIYVISPKIRQVFQEEQVQRMIRKDGRLDFGLDLIPYLVQSGRRIYGYVLQGRWFDIGTPAGYLEAMSKLLRTGAEGMDLEGRVPRSDNLWIEGHSPEALARREAILQQVEAGEIRLGGSVLIGRHCLLGAGASVRDSCIDNYSIIGENAVIEGSAIMDRVILQRSAEIRGSIVGRHVIVQSTSRHPTQISDLSVVGDDVSIGEGCEISGSRIYPHSRVPEHRRLVNEVFRP